MRRQWESVPVEALTPCRRECSFLSKHLVQLHSPFPRLAGTFGNVNSAVCSRTPEIGTRYRAPSALQHPFFHWRSEMIGRGGALETVVRATRSRRPRRHGDARTWRAVRFFFFPADCSERLSTWPPHRATLFRWGCPPCSGFSRCFHRFRFLAPGSSCLPFVPVRAFSSQPFYSSCPN